MVLSNSPPSLVQPDDVQLTSVPTTARAKFSDTLDIDQERNLLFLADNWSSGVDVFDISAREPRFIRSLRLRGRLYGVAVASDLGRLFVGMTGSLVASVDLNSESYGVTYTATGGSTHVDLLDYDPTGKRLFAANRLDGLLTCIDASTNEILGQVEGLGRGLEQPRFNPADGMVYLTDNRDNVLFQIDVEKFELTARHALPDSLYPNGMAIDSKSNQALLVGSTEACPICVLWDLDRQRVARIYEDSGCGDGVMFDPNLECFLVASSCHPGGPVVAIFSGTPPRLASRIPTAPDASWVAVNTALQRIYTPATTPSGPALLSFDFPKDLRRGSLS